jgi:hypothetical protein
MPIEINSPGEDVWLQVADQGQATLERHGAPAGHDSSPITIRSGGVK